MSPRVFGKFDLVCDDEVRRKDAHIARYLKMSFAKTKEDLLLRSVSFTGIPCSVTGDQVKQAVFQHGCDPVAVFNVESPSLTTSSTWLVLFQDHNMSKMFLHNQDLKYDFGDGPMEIETRTTTPCQIPSDWLESSKDEINHSATEQQTYPTGAAQPHPYPQRVYFPGYPPPAYSSGDFNTKQQHDPARNPQYGYPPQQLYYPYMQQNQDGGAQPIVYPGGWHMGPPPGMCYPPSSADIYTMPKNILPDTVNAENFTDQQMGDHIAKDQGEYLEKIQRKKAEEENRSDLSKYQQEDDVKMIKVTILPDGVTEDLLLNYFENKRRNGGGPVEDVDLDMKNRTAIITFEKADAVKRVMQKCPHLLREKLIDVEEYIIEETEEESDLETMADNEADEMQGAVAVTRIKVENVPTSITSDTLLNYFENTRRSGGGDIKDIEYDKEKGVALIKFEDESAVQGVIKKNHKVDGCEILVAAYIPPKPRPTYEDKLLIRGLNEDTTQDCLFNFLEAKTGVAATAVMYGEDTGTALITFEEKPDIEKLQTACKTRKLEGAHLQVSKVPVSNCVHITEFSPKSSEDTLTFYFENPKHGGDLEKVDFRKDEECCLIYFVEQSVAESVCKISHKIDGKILKLKTFHDCLGPGAEEGHKKFKLPKSLIISDQDPNKIKFLKNSTSNKEDLEKQMSTCYARTEWPSKQVDPLLLHCTLTKDIKGWNKLVKDWEKTVRENLIVFMDMLMVKSFSVLQDLWQSVISQMGSLTVPAPENVGVITDIKSGSIIVCGIKHDMENVAKQIEEIIRDVEAVVERKKQQIKESKTFKPFQLKMILALRLSKELETKYKDLKVKITFDKKEVLFEGISKDIKAAQLVIFEKMQNIIHSKLSNMSSRKIQFMSSRPVKDYIISRLQDKKVIGVWEIENNKVCVYGMSDRDAAMVAHLVKDSIVECPLEMEKESIPIMSSAKWHEMVEDTEQNNVGLVKIHTEIDELKIFILSTDNLATGILEIVSDFLKFNTIKEMFLSYQRGVLQFLLTHNKKEVDDCEKNLQLYHGVMSVTDNGIAIKGTEEGLNQAKYKLNQLADQVMKRTHMLDQPGIPKYISSEKGKERLQNIERSNNCIIGVHGSSEDLDDDDSTNEGFEILQAPPAISLPGQKIHAICSLENGVSIYALEGDMTELKVDAIVNAANPELEHAGGLAQAIVNKGGKVIQDECTAYVNKHKKLRDGAVFCSSAGKLQCKAVIHAVGPRWQGGDNLEKDSLEAAVLTALEETAERKFTSIAIPALSSGVYGFPIRLCARVIVGAIKEHLKDKSGTTKEIYLCDMKSNTVFQFKEALMQEFGSDTVVVGQGAQSLNKPVPARKPRRKLQSNDADDGVASGHRHSSGNIKVVIVRGEIAKEQVDVIVNTTSKDLNLNSGAVSKSLLAVAGQQLQQECQQNYPGGLQPEQVAETRGGNLQCNVVCHGSLPGWDPSGSSVPILMKFMTTCLKSTQKNGMSSISFPALGTGNLGYPRDVVAKQMFICVSNFAASNPSSSVNEVRFVVYPGDTATVKAFEMEEQAGGSGGASDRRAGDRRHTRKFSTQESESAAPYSEGRHFRTDDQSLKIGNILLKIFSGNLIETKVDCIVNGSNRDLNLKQGAVSQAILKAAGKDLESQCSKKRKEMEQNGVAVTTAGKLACKWIVHVAAPGSNGRSSSAWKKVIKCSLKEADEIPVKTIAFPLLGQSYQMTVEDSAKALTEAVCDFSKSPPAHVCEICVVIFDKKNIAPYIKSVHATLTSHSEPKKGILRSITSTVTDFLGFSSKEHDSNAASYEQKQVTLMIFGNLQRDIDSAIKSIERMCESEFSDKVFADDSVKDLSSSQITKIKQLQSKFNVCIEFEISRGRIQIKGITNDVMNTNDEIHSILKEVVKLKHKQSEADILKKVVQWYCIDQATTGQQLVPYAAMVNLKIETAYNESKVDVTFKDNDGIVYGVNFTNMEEYAVQNPSDKVTVIRRDQLKESSFEVPASWAVMGQDENLKVVMLQSTDPEYTALVPLIAALGKTVTKIDRIQNQTLYQQYAAKKKLMKQNSTAKAIEQHLWHGTSLDTVDSINTHGFNRSYCGKNATAYGDGVYFAVNPNYSAHNQYSRPDASGSKRMYYSLVLTGDFTLGKQGMRVPPPKDPKVPHVLYDCVVDKAASPGMYIIFHDTQAYPEYLVTFK